MSGSFYLAQALNNPRSVQIDGSGPLGGWEDAYMINGAHRECHPDFIAKPISDGSESDDVATNRFLICQRKKDEYGVPLDIKYSQERVNLPNKPGTTGTKAGEGYHTDCNKMYMQSYDLYPGLHDGPNKAPRLTYAGGQPRDLPHRRLPNQAHLQGADYYRDSLLFSGIGDEPIDREMGDFGYKENKYYFSAPPPLFDITHALQPYEFWKREQLMRGTIDERGMNEFEKRHNFVSKASTF
jgi:hypothetical protein